MTAAFWKDLVFDLDRAGAGTFQHTYRLRDVHGIAEAGVGIDNDRQARDVANGHRMLGKLTEVHEAEIRQAQMRIGDPRAGQIDRLESEISDDARSEGVCRARDNHASLAAQYVPQALYVVTHRVTLRVRKRASRTI